MAHAENITPNKNKTRTSIPPSPHFRTEARRPRPCYPTLRRGRRDAAPLMNAAKSCIRRAALCVTR
ncbi:hypothetical protein CSIRO_1754 [Bradyrhizobiaceae bacterium SG-6C]|nr:hypothetical protein CSIRO_1754 [Bradyrhizobiaceae bacterium SG-6C]